MVSKTPTAYTLTDLKREVRACNRAGMDVPATRLFMAGFQRGTRYGFLKGMSRMQAIVAQVRGDTHILGTPDYPPGSPGFRYLNTLLTCPDCRWHGLRLEARLFPNDVRQSMDALCPVCGGLAVEVATVEDNAVF